MRSRITVITCGEIPARCARRRMRPFAVIGYRTAAVRAPGRSAPSSMTRGHGGWTVRDAASALHTRFPHWLLKWPTCLRPIAIADAARDPYRSMRRRTIRVDAIGYLPAARNEGAEIIDGDQDPPHVAAVTVRQFQN